MAEGIFRSVIRREGEAVRNGLNICPEARCVCVQLFGIRVYVRLVAWRSLPIVQVYNDRG